MVRMLADVTSTNIGVWRLEKPYPPWESPIEELFESHPDRDLFGSLPGAGSKLAPRLLGEIGDDRERFDGDAQNLRNRPGRSRLALRQFL